jgi:hypothetical protein
MRRISFVEHAEKHDHQQDEIFDEIDQNAPLELVGASESTCAQNWRPLGVTLGNSGCQRNWACAHTRNLFRPSTQLRIEVTVFN